MCTLLDPGEMEYFMGWLIIVEKKYKLQVISEFRWQAKFNSCSILFNDLILAISIFPDGTLVSVWEFFKLFQFLITYYVPYISKDFGICK